MHSTDKKQTNDLKEISLLPKNAYVIHVLTKNYQPMVRSLNVFTKHLTVHALDKQQLAKPSEPASTSRYLERLNSKSEFIDLGFLSNTFNINIMRWNHERTKKYFHDYQDVINKVPAFTHPKKYLFMSDSFNRNTSHFTSQVILLTLFNGWFSSATDQNLIR